MANKYDRQVQAFGKATQQKLASSVACIVGLGGIGSQLAQALAYLGLGSLVLIDDDVVEDSNLNRLIGASAADVGRKKVTVISDLIARTNPTALCKPIAKNIRSREALEEASKASVLFGCVDNDGARLILTELCCSYKVSYIDSATEFFVEAGEIKDFGGRVVVSKPGDFCLSCAGEIDMEAAKAQLEPETTRKIRQEHGYGFGPLLPSPAVVSLNGIVANIAATEFLMMMSSVREPFRKSTYKGMRGVLQVSRDFRRDDCFNCGYLVGLGESADIFRYALSE